VVSADQNDTAHGIGSARRWITSYWLELDRRIGAWAYIEFMTSARGVIDYSIVLLMEENGQAHTVRLYDGAHGVNELHRYTRLEGKHAAETFHSGTLGMGMRAAIDEIKRNYRSIIEGWRKR
jgi:hypothetical protein